jgi:hypothetical protein
MYLSLLICFAATLARPDDAAPNWKLYSFAKMASGPLVLFYASDSVKRVPGTGYIRVWMEAFEEQNLGNSLGSMSKERLSRAAAKYVAGYAPPILKVESVTEDQMITFIEYEELADQATLPPNLRALEEVNCSDRTYRELSVVVGSHDRSPSSSSIAWRFAPPNTPIAHLVDLACGTAK